MSWLSIGKIGMKEKTTRLGSNENQVSSCFCRERKVRNFLNNFNAPIDLTSNHRIGQFMKALVKKKNVFGLR